jgi:murein DD-endopeptidase MepM/ murein hydrolase activator NlpD
VKYEGVRKQRSPDELYEQMRRTGETIMNNENTTMQEQEVAMVAEAPRTENVVLLPRKHVTLDPKFIDPMTGGDGNLRYPFVDADGTVQEYATPGAFTSPVNDETKAKALVLNLKPQMYMAAPRPAWPLNFDINVAAGWFYTDTTKPKNSELHGAIDYTRDFAELDGKRDPSFEVCAVTTGKVVARFWDNLTGNTIIIEHVAANGTKYRSIYCHLRNGPEADAANALSIPFDAATDNLQRRYHRFTTLGTRPALWWGTNSQTMMVKSGDMVNLGQQIGWAGNTGYGGAGGGLNMDGTPKSPNFANVHLHLFFAVPMGLNEWMLIDPYGVYDSAVYAYGFGNDSAYTRFFQPH